MVRCRALEGEALLWSEEQLRLLARLADREARIADHDARSADRDALVADVEARLSAAETHREERERAHRDALRAALDRQARALSEAHEAERHRLSTDHHEALSAAEDRIHGARHDLVEAERAFRVEAYRLSALVALKAQEAERGMGEAAALRERLHALLTSSSWRLSRPIRAIGRVIARIRP